jgi:hypothetical protein
MNLRERFTPLLLSMSQHAPAAVLFVTMGLLVACATPGDESVSPADDVVDDSGGGDVSVDAAETDAGEALTWEAVCGGQSTTWPADECLCPEELYGRNCCDPSGFVAGCNRSGDGTFETHSGDGHWDCDRPEYRDLDDCPPPPCREGLPFPCECGPEVPGPGICCYDPGGANVVYSCSQRYFQWEAETRHPDCDDPYWAQYVRLPFADCLEVTAR